MPTSSTSGARRQPTAKDIKALQAEVADLAEKLALSAGRVEALEASIEAGLSDAQFVDQVLISAAVAGGNMKPTILIQRAQALLEQRAKLKAAI